MRKVFLTGLMIVFTSAGLLASAVEGERTKITDLQYQTNGPEQGMVAIKVEGQAKTPELFIKDDTIIQVTFKDAVVWPKIEKKISVGEKPFDTTLTAFQFNQQEVRFRAFLPYSLKGMEGKVTVTMKDNNTIQVIFPRKNVDTVAVTAIAPPSTKSDANKYDETFLENLLKDKKEIDSNNNTVNTSNKNKKAIKDQVKSSFAGLEKKAGEASQFSLIPYVSKFVGFLALVLLLFYGVVVIIKKAMARRGKLGLLKDMESVAVLSTTYLGPKKSLMVVKAHQQVFLLGTSETGIHFLSEIRDVPSAFKDTEKGISGNNFDISLAQATVNDRPVTMKETPASNEPNGGKSLSEFLSTNNVDKVKISQQIKNKVKSLKPLQ
ncbi:MAG: flagellar biosynthetic protein FliO [Pseudomonadota bacterium]